MTSTQKASALTHDATRDGYRATHSMLAAPGTVFGALTSAAAISRWWAPCTGTGFEGGRLRFLFGDAELVIDVIAAEPDGHVRWAVTDSEPLPEWVGTHIDFTLGPSDGGGTVIDFCHEGLTDAFTCYDMCSAGWRQYLPSLVDYVDRDGGTAFGSEDDERAEHWEQARSRG